MLSSDGLKGKTAWVKVKRSINGLDGDPVKVGSVIQLPLAAAHEAVYNGTAEFCDAPKADAAGRGGAAGKGGEGQ